MSREGYRPQEKNHFWKSQSREISRAEERETMDMIATRIMHIHNLPSDQCLTNQESAYNELDGKPC